MNTTCPRCRDKTTKLCDACQQIKYCSPVCLQTDAHAHKLVCRSFKDVAATAPGAGVRRIIVFLPDEKKPRFTWAPVSQSIGGVYPENERYSEDIDMNDVTDLAGEKHALTAAYTCKNAWTGDALERTIKIVFDENASANYESRNQAVLAATQGMDDMGWRGPVVACCGTLGGGDHGFDIASLHDMDMEAYSHLVGFLIGYRNKTPQRVARLGSKVNCVKVACEGDRDNDMPAHQIVRVPRSHPVFVGEVVSCEVSEASSAILKSAQQESTMLTQQP